MPSREFQEEDSDASLSKRRNMQPPPIPAIGRAVTWIGLETVSETNDDLNAPRDAMPLKRSGEKMEIRWAQFWADEMRKLLEEHPDHFQALHRLAEGNKEGVSEGHFRELREWGYLGGAQK